MLTIVDQTGATVKIPAYPPKRIVSLVPSQTELLHYLGLEEEVVGITKFCVHPQSWFRNKTRVGGTKSVHIDIVKSLCPDLIIGNKEENIKTEVEALSTIAPVWVSDIGNLNDALEMIKQVGVIVDKQEKADRLAVQIEAGFIKLASTANIHPSSSHFQILKSSNLQINPNVAYLIWREPYMTVGGDTFIGDMLRRCGFANIFEQEKRYPVITLEQIAALGCRYLFLSSEPFPFKEEHANEIRNQLPGIKVVFVDGEMFSWYGNRLLLAVQYFRELKESLNHDFNHDFA
jgi:ABC-type Fe3+-hydroxamate transport system substrate-binding protein